MNGIKNLVGQRFGKLVVVSLNRIEKGCYWNCKCDCGGEKITHSQSLRRGSCTSCGCNSRFRDLLGKVFGRLTVIKRVENHKDNCAQWKCKCECGKESIVKSVNLINGFTKSCGCIKVEIGRERIKQITGWNKLPVGEASFNRLLNVYRSQATSRGYSFNLTREEFYDLTQQPCHYCGTMLSNSMNCKGSQMNGIFRYNGIDRVDNSVGYEKENTVACCKICNKMKGSISKSEFLAHALRIKNHMESVK